MSQVATAIRAGRGRLMELTLAQLRLEQRNFWRNRQSATFSFGMPLMIVVLLGGLFKGGGGTVGVGGASYSSYFVAGMVGVALLSATFVNLAISLAFQRDLLVLKRFRGTPLGAGPLFAAKVLNGVIVVVIQVAIILAIGRLAYGTAFPKNWPAFLLAILAGVCVFSMAGVAVTAFIANADSAPAVVNLPYLALQFVSGVFFSFQNTPAWLRVVGDLFPLRWLVDTLRAGYLGLDYVHTRRVPDLIGPARGTRLAPIHVHGVHAITAMGPAYAVMAAWMGVFTFIALTRFRWEPRAG
ncbi:MAG TPA: ABC transporter permease [Acidimicrobiales bacterium]|nr:ABC transporter permease [Acidimicrobiales bacterium]